MFVHTSYLDIVVMKFKRKDRFFIKVALCTTEDKWYVKN